MFQTCRHFQLPVSLVRQCRALFQHGGMDGHFRSFVKTWEHPTANDPEDVDSNRDCAKYACRRGIVARKIIQPNCRRQATFTTSTYFIKELQKLRVCLGNATKEDYYYAISSIFVCYCVIFCSYDAPCKRTSAGFLSALKSLVTCSMHVYCCL